MGAVAGLLSLLSPISLLKFNLGVSEIDMQFGDETESDSNIVKVCSLSVGHFVLRGFGTLCLQFNILFLENVYILLLVIYYVP